MIRSDRNCFKIFRSDRAFFLDAWVGSDQIESFSIGSNQIEAFFWPDRIGASFFFEMPRSDRIGSRFQNGWIEKLYIYIYILSLLIWPKTSIRPDPDRDIWIGSKSSIYIYILIRYYDLKIKILTLFTDF